MTSVSLKQMKNKKFPIIFLIAEKIGRKGGKLKEKTSEALKVYCTEETEE